MAKKKTSTKKKEPEAVLHPCPSCEYARDLSYRAGDVIGERRARCVNERCALYGIPYPVPFFVGDIDA